MRKVWMEQENPDSAITAKARERRHRWGSPRTVVDGSIDLDGPHGIGAG
jgi:hypothetical protein